MCTLSRDIAMASLREVADSRYFVLVSTSTSLHTHSVALPTNVSCHAWTRQDNEGLYTPLGVEPNCAHCPTGSVAPDAGAAAAATTAAEAGGGAAAATAVEAGAAAATATAAEAGGASDGSQVGRQCQHCGALCMTWKQVPTADDLRLPTITAVRMPLVGVAMVCVPCAACSRGSMRGRLMYCGCHKQRRRHARGNWWTGWKLSRPSMQRSHRSRGKTSDNMLCSCH